MDAGHSPDIFLIAGEPSGDALGAGLMAAIARKTGGRAHFRGVGGPRMEAEGLTSIFPMADLSVMGITEVLPRLPRILKRMRQTAAAIGTRPPEILITIDAPAFCEGVWRRLKDRQCTRVHYVAPTVWAWRPERAGRLASRIDHLMTLLPFEPPYFEREGLDTTFVGHPAAAAPETPSTTTPDSKAFRASHGLQGASPLIGVFPGSRGGEVRRMLGPFGDAVSILARRYPDLRVIVPTVSGVAAEVRSTVAGWPGAPILVDQSGEHAAARGACDIALAASGTVSLELSLAGVPTVVGYRMNPATYQTVRRLIRVPYISLTNILLDEPVIPECIQRECTGEALAAAVCTLLDDASARRAQRDAGHKVASLLGADDARHPDERAADVVLSLL